MIVVLFILIAILFFLLGGRFGYMVADKDTKTLLNTLSKVMNDLREKSFLKRDIRNQMEIDGNVIESKKLSAQLEAEAAVFLPIQNAVRIWCDSKDVKNPF